MPDELLSLLLELLLLVLLLLLVELLALASTWPFAFFTLDVLLLTTALWKL